jgi:hypothetical protein
MDFNQRKLELNTQFQRLNQQAVQIDTDMKKILGAIAMLDEIITKEKEAPVVEKVVEEIKNVKKTNKK